ncbi:MAG: hypothetical protein IT290_03855 [Deltaproteobacteria bacterium]|nr:hypothetical protein [Deltaproteobacteria bacterium]
MERADEELLLNLSEHDTHLKKLYDRHMKLEREVTRYTQYASYSPFAALRASELKREKLRDMDHIMECLRRHRTDEARPPE